MLKSITSSEVSEKNDSFPYFSDKLKIQSKIVFFIIGLISFISWNDFTHIANSMAIYIFGDVAVGDNMLLIFETSPFVAMLLFAYIGGVRPKFMIFNLIFGISFTILLAAQIYFANNPSIINHYLIYATSLILGFSMGTTLSLGYALSSITSPVIFSGYFSLGQGCSSVSAFLVFLIGNEIFWPQPIELLNVPRFKNTVLLVFSASVFFHLVGLTSFYSLYNTKWYKNCLENALKSHKQDKHKENQSLEQNHTQKQSSHTQTQSQTEQTQSQTEQTQSTQQPATDSLVDVRDSRPVKYVIKDSIWYLSSAYLYGFILFLMYPLIVPYSWTGSNFKENMVGLYQASDFISRYTANFFIYKWKPHQKLLFTLSISRGILIPFSTLPVLNDDTIFNTTTYQVIFIIIMGVSTGSLIVYVFASAPLCVTRIKERGKIGTYCSFCGQFGATSSIYLSKLLKLILYKIK